MYSRGNALTRGNHLRSRVERFPGEYRPMLLVHGKNRGPVPSLRIVPTKESRRFLPIVSARGKGSRRICFVPARSIFERSGEGTKGKSSGIRDGKKGTGGKKGKVVYLFGAAAMSAGSSNRASGFISYDNDIQTENIGARIDEDLARHLPTWRTISSPGETRLSINLYAPLYFSSSSGHRRYLVLPAIRIGLAPGVGTRATHAGHPVTRAHLSRTRNIIPPRRTPFRLRLRNDDDRRKV